MNGNQLAVNGETRFRTTPFPSKLLGSMKNTVLKIVKQRVKMNPSINK